MNVQPVNLFEPVPDNGGEVKFPNKIPVTTQPAPVQSYEPTSDNVPLPDNFQRQEGDYTRYENTPPVPSPNIGKQGRTPYEQKVINATKFNTAVIPHVRDKVFEEIDNMNITDEDKDELKRRLDKFIVSQSFSLEDITGSKLKTIGISLARGAYNALPIVPEVYKLTDISGLKPTTAQKISSALGNLITTAGTLFATEGVGELPKVAEVASKLNIPEKLAAPIYKGLKDAFNWALVEGVSKVPNEIIKTGTEHKSIKDAALEVGRSLKEASKTGATVGAIGEIVNRAIPNPIVSFPIKVLLTSLTQAPEIKNQLDNEDYADLVLTVGQNMLLSLDKNPTKMKAYTKKELAQELAKTVQDKIGIENSIKLLDKQQQDIARKINDSRHRNGYILGQLNKNFYKVLDEPQNKAEMKKFIKAVKDETAAKTKQYNINEIQRGKLEKETKKEIKKVNPTINDIKLTEIKETIPGKVSKKVLKKIEKLKNLDKENYDINLELGEKARVKRNKNGEVVKNRYGKPVIEINPEKIINEAEAKYVKIKYKEELNKARKEFAEKYNNKELKKIADKKAEEIKKAKYIYHRVNWDSFKDLDAKDIHDVIYDTFTKNKADKIYKDIIKAKNSNAVHKTIADAISGGFINDELGGGDPKKLVTNLAVLLKDKYGFDTEYSKEYLEKQGFKQNKVNSIISRMFKPVTPANWDSRIGIKEAVRNVQDIFNKWQHVQADIVSDVSAYTKYLDKEEQAILLGRLIPEAIRRAHEDKKFNISDRRQEIQKFIKSVVDIKDEERLKRLTFTLSKLDSGLKKSKNVLLDVIKKRLGEDSNIYKKLKEKNGFYFPTGRNLKDKRYTVIVTDPNKGTLFYAGARTHQDALKIKDSIIKGDTKLGLGADQNIKFDKNKHSILLTDIKSKDKLIEPKDSVFALTTAHEAITNYFKKISKDPNVLNDKNIEKTVLEQLKTDLQHNVSKELLSKTNTTRHLMEQRYVAGATIDDLDKAVRNYIRHITTTARADEVAKYGLAFLQELKKNKAPADSIKDLSIIFHDILSSSDNKLTNKLARSLGSIIAFKYMAGRVSSGAWNMLSAIPNTYLSSAFLKGFKGSPTAEMLKAIKDITKFERDMRIKDKGKNPKLSYLTTMEQEALLYAYSHGGVDTPFTDMMSEFFYNEKKLVKQMFKLGYVFMRLTERPARGITFLTMYRMLDKNADSLTGRQKIYELYRTLRHGEKGKYDKEILNDEREMQKAKTYIAIDLLKKSHGDYSKVNKTLIERNKYGGAIASMVLKLMKYQINQVAAYLNAYSHGDKLKVLQALGSIALMGGASALPLLQGGNNVYEYFKTLFTGYYEPSAVTKFLNKSSVLSRGLTILLGVDASQGVNISIPTSSILQSAYRDLTYGSKEIANGKPLKGLLRMTSTEMFNIYNAFERRFGTPTTLYGYEQLYKGKPLHKYNNFDFVMKLLGLSPAVKDAEVTRNLWTERNIVHSYNNYTNKLRLKMRKALRRKDYKELRKLFVESVNVYKTIIRKHPNLRAQIHLINPNNLATKKYIQ